MRLVTKRRQRVGSTHSLTVRPDIRGYRCANSRKATCSRLIDVITSTTAVAENRRLANTASNGGNGSETILQLLDGNDVRYIDQ